MQTPKCTKNTYTLFLIAEPKTAHCTTLARIMGDMAHDAVNRFLNRENFTPHDLFEENKQYIPLVGCSLSIDDCVLDKPYANPRYTDLVNWLYSGLHHRVVKGIGIVTLFACDPTGNRFPINYRIYEKEPEKAQKTKNDLFQEMIEEVLSWGIHPAIVTGDAWYGSVENMKFLDAKSIPWLFGLKENRIVSETPHEHHPISDIDIPHEGKMVHLKGYKHVRVFRRDFKHDVPKHYATSIQDLSPEDFETFHTGHWGIETYHRAIKQLCNAETSMVRSAKGQRNHLFCVLRAFSFLEKKVISKRIKNWYAESKSLYDGVIRNYIKSQRLCLVHA